VAIKSFDKIRNIAEYIRQGRLKALEDLSPAERLEATQMMQALKTATITRRNELEPLIKAQKGTDDFAREFNQLTKEINEEVTNQVLPEILKGKNDKMAKAIVAWGDHNDRVI